MDEFCGAKIIAGKAALKAAGEKVTLEALEEYAEAQLQKRMTQIEDEIRIIEGGHFDACVSVSIRKSSAEKLKGCRFC
jgi:hypothetical protein